jgi:hypothetical protein
MSDKVTLEEAIRLVGEGYMEDDRPSTIHLAETLWEEAIEGNMRAAKMILEYSIGRPKLSPEAVEDLRDEILFDEDGNPVERPYDDVSDHIPSE